jgi:hypothetical protein
MIFKLKKKFNEYYIKIKHYNLIVSHKRPTSFACFYFLCDLKEKKAVEEFHCGKQEARNLSLKIQSKIKKEQISC